MIRYCDGRSKQRETEVKVLKKIKKKCRKGEELKSDTRLAVNRQRRRGGEEKKERTEIFAGRNEVMAARGGRKQG